MSDLTTLLDTMKAIAAKDIPAEAAGAIATATPTLFTSIATGNAASAGVALLGAVAPYALQFGADELNAVGAWTVAEVQKYTTQLVSAIAAKV